MTYITRPYAVMAVPEPDMIGEQRAQGECALYVIAAHLFLTCMFGQSYGKLKLPIGPVYATEVALGVAVVLSLHLVSLIQWDRISKLVLCFCGLGVGWVVWAGLGPAGGAGTKAFSFFVYGGFYFLVRGVATDSRKRWLLLRATMFGVAGAAIVGFWNLQTGVGFPTSTGSLRWLPGEYALYSIFGAAIVIVVALAQRTLGTSERLVLLAALVVQVLAQHRSGFVAAGVATLGTTAVVAGSARSLTTAAKLGALAIGIAAVVLWLFGHSYVAETIDRIEHTTDLSDGTVGWRLLSWYEVGTGVINQPIGHGFAVWDFLFTWKDPLIGSHNSLLDLTYRVGVPGLILFLSMPLTIFLGARRIFRVEGLAKQPILVVAIACLLGFLGFAFFNVVLETPYMSVFFWVFLGIGAGALHDARASIDALGAGEERGGHEELPQRQESEARVVAGIAAK